MTPTALPHRCPAGARPPATSRPLVQSRLRRALRERQMQPAELAELAGLDAAIVARALAPAPVLFLDEALALATALGCPLRTLFLLA